MASPIRSYILTAHAIDEMARRRIDRSAVKTILGAPELRGPVRPGRDVLQSRVVIDGKSYLIRVFVDVDREPAEVVTVYRTSKIEKYWSEGP